MKTVNCGKKFSVVIYKSRVKKKPIKTTFTQELRHFVKHWKYWNQNRFKDLQINSSVTISVVKKKRLVDSKGSICPIFSSFSKINRKRFVIHGRLSFGILTDHPITPTLLFGALTVSDKVWSVCVCVLCDLERIVCQERKKSRLFLKRKTF